MFKLKYLILLILISFSLQDNNCLVYFESCEVNYSTITITDCTSGYFYYDENKEKIEFCDECKNGYALSYDSKKCIYLEIPIQYCTYQYLDSEGQIFCSECEKTHALSYDRKSCTALPNQIENCISYFLNNEGNSVCGECKDDYFRINFGKSCIEFKNCNHLYDSGKCESCNTGYALSYDEKSCVQFENCEKLAKGDEKCSKCVKYFHPNTDGKCERTQCEVYANNVCTKCYEGYYLNNDKNCLKIPIENCLEMDSQKKCTKCLGDITPDSEGKCNLPSILIKGCIKYGNSGKCIECYDKNNEYQLNSEGGCDFIGCDQTENKYEYCRICKVGYYLEKKEDDNDYICIGYGGSEDISSDSSSRNKYEFILLIFLSILLI